MQRFFREASASDRVDAFFYGLFMDPDALRAQGLQPHEQRKAHVPGMTLKIGNRATLIPDENGVAHGLVMTLRPAELDRLYSEPSVAAYRPELVNCRCEDGSAIVALCYNLDEPGDEPPNCQYAAELRTVAERMGLPADYVASIG